MGVFETISGPRHYCEAQIWPVFQTSIGASKRGPPRARGQLPHCVTCGVSVPSECPAACGARSLLVSAAVGCAWYSTAHFCHKVAQRAIKSLDLPHTTSACRIPQHCLCTGGRVSNPAEFSFSTLYYPGTIAAPLQDTSWPAASWTGLSSDWERLLFGTAKMR